MTLAARPQPDDLADRLHYLRDLRGYTQDQCSTLLHIRRSTYAKYESGQRTPHLEIIFDVSEIYQISIDIVLKGTWDQFYDPALFIRPSPPPLSALLQIYCALSEERRQLLRARAFALAREKQQNNTFSLTAFGI